MEFKPGKYLTIGNVFKGLIALTVLIFIILFFSDGCGQGDAAKKIKEESDAAKARYELKIKSLDAEATILKDSMNTLKHEREEAVLSRNHSAMLVRQSSNKAAELARQLKDAKAQKDTVRLLVICDSLGNVVSIQEEQIKELIWTIEQTDSLMMYEVEVRNQVIELLQNKFISADSAYKSEKGRFDKLYTTLRPRNKYYLGGEVIGGRETIFAQAGAVVSLNTKGDKLYQASVGLSSNGQPYMRLNANFKISFRKK